MKDIIRLLVLFKPYWRWMALGVLLALLTVLANVALLALSGWFITAMALAGVAGLGMNYFTPAALIRGAALVRTVGRYGERLVTHEATFRLIAQLRVWFYEQLEPLAPAGLAAYRSGDLLSRVRADIDRLDHVYLRLFLPVAVALLATVIFVIFLLWFHPLLAVVEVVLLALAGGLLPWWVNKRGQHSSAQQVHLASELRAALVSDLQGMAELQIYGAAEAHAAEVERLAQALAQQQSILGRLQGLSQAALSLCASLAMWGVLVVAIPLVNTGQLAAPQLAMLALFALASFEAVMPLPLAFQLWGETQAAARRIFSVADQAVPVSDPAKPAPLNPPLHWRLDDVSYCYTAASQAALSAVNLDIPPGKRLALVGATGAGKSTLLSLLLRFQEPSTGTVYLNDQAVQAYAADAVRAHLAVLPQQSHLFNTTISANLRLAKPDASAAELEQMCRIAMIHSTIIAQPAGYETLVGETGLRLSGGQARRVALARALLKPAQCLILDEPTEGLDPESARAVMDNVLAHVTAQGQSLIVITHRLNGLAALDEVVVLDKGRIVQQGAHADLQQQAGVYQHYLEQMRLVE